MDELTNVAPNFIEEAVLETNYPELDKAVKAAVSGTGKNKKMSVLVINNPSFADCDAQVMATAIKSATSQGIAVMIVPVEQQDMFSKLAEEVFTDHVDRPVDDEATFSDGGNINGF